VGLAARDGTPFAPHTIKNLVHLLMDGTPEEISSLIVSYLGKHPDAQDTLENIVSWWLTFERIDLSTAAVAEALNRLVHQGIVAAQRSRTGRTLYRLNRCN
jgi:hypothetical protein